MDPVDRYEALNRVEVFLRRANRPHSVLAVNPEKNFSVRNDRTLHETIKKADLLLPDGIGIVWAARMLYGARLERVCGADFIFDICQLAAKKGYGVFIFGASEKTNKKAADILKSKFPGLIVAGRSNGYVRRSEMEHLLDCINKSRAKILFIALGSPKQENWFAQYHHNLNFIRVCQCIGGTLDTISGNVKRAPEIWQKFYLEWFYRLISQPKRLRRQKVLPIFVFFVLLAKLKRLIF